MSVEIAGNVLSDQKASVTLAFSGRNSEVRLEQVLFSNHLGTHQVNSADGAWRPQGSFAWTAAVQSMCLLLVRSAKSVFDPHSPPVELSGGKGSPATSLDNAISKGAD